LRELGFGGTETYLADLLPLLSETCEPHLVVAETNAGPLAQRLLDERIPIHHVPIEQRFGLADARRLAKALAEWRPDVVHTVSLTFHAVARAAAVLAGHGALVTDYRNAFARKFAKRPYLRCEPALRRVTDALLFASPALLCDYLDYWKLTPESPGLPVMEWHQGIRLDRFHSPGLNLGGDPVIRAELERELNLTPGRRFIGIVARFHPQKRHDLFFGMAREVAASVPEADFLVIGDGELATRQAYEAHVRALGLSHRVHFLGQRADISHLLRGLEVFVLCSDYEGLSRSMLEAMASGVPTVLAQPAETLGLLRDGLDVALVERQEPAAYARRVLEVLQNESLQRRLAQEGSRAVDNLSIARSAEKLQRLYAQILASPRHLWRRRFCRLCPRALRLQPSRYTAPLPIS
jgi:glycosyltransferase involved in cell wall biosynthesis